MVVIPTSVVLSIVGIGFVAIPAGLSLFCKNKKVNKIASSIGMLGFALIVSIMTLSNVSMGNTLTKISFSPTTSWFSKDFNFWAGNLKDYIINTSMFLPVGMIASQNYISKNTSQKSTFLKSLLIGFSFSTLIELSQFAMPMSRCPSFNDIILNTLSAGLGAQAMFSLHNIKQFIDEKRALTKAHNINETGKQIIFESDKQLVNHFLKTNKNEKKLSKKLNLKGKFKTNQTETIEQEANDDQNLLIEL